MSQTHMPSLEAVAKFYDNTTAMNILFGHSIHLGCWPDGNDDTSLAQTQDRLTDLVAARCGLREEMRLLSRLPKALSVTRAGCDGGSGDCAGDRRKASPELRTVLLSSCLDVGCGSGGPARRLAHATGAAVTGVTISPKQVEQATAQADQEGLASLARFQVAEATELPFADGEFDAAIAIESVLHVPDKPRALREVFRVLRPGATLVLADLTQGTPEVVTAETTGAAALLDLFSAPTQDGYRRLLAEAGFQVTDVLDLSPHTRPCWAKFRQRLDDRHLELAEAVGEQRVAAMKEVFRLYGEAAAAGVVGYVLITAHKS